MTDRNIKKGQQVSIELVQTDEDGSVISEISGKWYGFNNADANEATMNLVSGIVDVNEGWRVAKKEEQSAGADRVSEPARGSIR